MKQRLLGHSGLRVSEFCLGSLLFGEKKKWGADAGTAIKILSTFADAGGTFIDTAPNYAGGVSEEIVGDFIQGQRSEFVVATKYTASNSKHPLSGGNSRKTLVRSVEESLSRLGTEYIDLLWLHYWDGTTPLEEIMRALDDLVSSGKVLYIGISDTPAWLISRAATLAELRGWSRVIATQLEYNLAARSVEEELLPMAHAMDIGVVCWGAFGAGALANPEGGVRLPEERRNEILGGVAHALKGMSSSTGNTPAGMAINWLKKQGCVPLVGARTVEQMQMTLQANREELSSELFAELDALAPPDFGFPRKLIESSYLRKFAFGNYGNFDLPERGRC